MKLKPLAEGAALCQMTTETLGNETIPLSDSNLKNELGLIRGIARDNGFDEKWINKLIYKKLQKIASRSIYSYISYINNGCKSKYVSMTYVGNISEKISIILKKFNTKVAFKPEQKLA